MKTIIGTSWVHGNRPKKFPPIPAGYGRAEVVELPCYERKHWRFVALPSTDSKQINWQRLIDITKWCCHSWGEDDYHYMTMFLPPHALVLFGREWVSVAYRRVLAHQEGVVFNPIRGLEMFRFKKV